MARRHKIRMDHPKQRGMVAVKYPFSQKIRCGCCGSQYIRGQIYSHGEMIPAWWCYSRRRSSKLCSQKGISEEAIEKAFVTILNDFAEDYKLIVETARSSVESTITEASDEKLFEINNRIFDLQKEMADLHAKKTLGKIIPDAYTKQGSKLAKLIDELKKKKEDILFNDMENNKVKMRLNEMLKVLDSYGKNDVFEAQIFKILIDEITVRNRNELTFKFKDGVTKTIVVNIK